MLLIAALAITVAAAAALIVTSDRASGAAAAQYQYGAPAPVAQPVVSGTAQAGKQLTTTNGTWSSSTAISAWHYEWTRCDAQGANCLQIPGASTSVYTLTAADIGHRIRSYVSATNAVGTTQGYSDPTLPVVGTVGPKLIPASNVVLPNRLVIDSLTYSQNPIRSRLTPTQMRVHVSDSGGNSVQGAQVYALGVPYSRIANAPIVATDATGWATLSLVPQRAFPRTGYLVLFVRATVQGQDLLGGTSTRRLVQVTIDAPNGT
jgi:hypothetical protein